MRGLCPVFSDVSGMGDRDEKFRMNYILECIDCKKRFSPEEVLYLCPECLRKQRPMSPLYGILKCVYDYDAVRKCYNLDSLEGNPVFGFARFINLLPLESEESLPPLITNFTPLRNASNLRRALQHDHIWIKDDTCQPTASFKDRASALVVAKAREIRRGTVATASTGNAATALAGQAASIGLKSVIFVPATAPEAKLTQIAIFGGRLIPIKGTYDEAFELSIAACDKFGWYNRNTAYNPYTIEGKKTAALEIWEQLNFSAPDWIVVPTGDGVILAGIEKGFADLKELGFIEKMPRLAVVQAALCRPIVSAWEKRAAEIIPEKNPKTIADSISVGVPRAGHWVMQALARTKGTAISVGDDEIVGAISLLGRTTGIFAEPAAATAIAGLKKLIENGTISSNEQAVALVTGSGLKDIPAAARAISIPKPIAPDLGCVTP